MVCLLEPINVTIKFKNSPESVLSGQIEYFVLNNVIRE